MQRQTLLNALPDELIPAWLFLTIVVDRNYPCRIRGWRVAVANPDHILDANEHVSEESFDESSELDRLLTELTPYRYEGITLVTFSRRALPLVRTRLLCTTGSDADATLRGFDHISLEQLVTNLLVEDCIAAHASPAVSEAELLATLTGSGDAIDIEDERRVRPIQMWRLTNVLAPLFPLKSLRGIKI